jgi:hypothetical protein
MAKKMIVEDVIITGMHCAACERVVPRALEKLGVQVSSLSRSGQARIARNGVANAAIEDALSLKGYGIEWSDRNQRAQRNQFATTLLPIEKRLLLTGGLTLLGLLLLQVLAVLFFLPNFQDHVAKYNASYVYIPIIIVTNVVALWHQRAYRATVSCMHGMMVGMTIGMTTGFGIGAIVGLINGMFWGSIIGMVVGIAAGAYAGRCCGTMGVMEGMMAGLMGGTMGAMLTVMMVLDHAAVFLPILIAVLTAILVGLVKMVIESRPDRCELRPWPAWVVIAISVGATIAITVFMAIAPKGLY